MKNSNTTQEEVQDMIGILMSKGYSLDQILGLGYIVPVEQDVKTMAVERKQNLLSMTQFLHVVISEVAKSPKYRSMSKLNHFLNMAIEQSDLFCKGLKEDEFLFHSLTPDFD